MKSLYVDMQSRVGAFEINVNLNLLGTGVLAVLGPSGSGKTTLLRSIAGLHSPDKGLIASNSRVFFNSSQNLDLPPQRRHIGFVFQDYALFDHMTVYENVMYGIREKANRARVHNWLQKLELDTLSGRYPKQLSGGQRQRVALARALVTEPAFLLLDEPFSAIDQSLRERVREDVSDLIHGIGIPTIMVTHDIHDARIMADHILLMDHGQVLQFGTRDEVLSNPKSSIAARILGWRNILPLPVLARHGLVDVNELAARNVDVVACSAGIQPYHLRFSQNDPASLPVTVLAILDRGAVREVKCRIMDTELPVYLDVPWNYPVPAKGEQARVSMSPAHVHIFGSCTEKPAAGLSGGHMVFPSVYEQSM